MLNLAAFLSSLLKLSDYWQPKFYNILNSFEHKDLRICSDTLGQRLSCCLLSLSPSAGLCFSLLNCRGAVCLFQVSLRACANTLALATGPQGPQLSLYLNLKKPMLNKAFPSNHKPQGKQSPRCWPVYLSRLNHYSHLSPHQTKNLTYLCTQHNLFCSLFSSKRKLTASSRSSAKQSEAVFLLSSLLHQPLTYICPARPHHLMRDKARRPNVSERSTDGLTRVLKGATWTKETNLITIVCTKLGPSGKHLLR